MKIALINSQQDLAGSQIRNHIEELLKGSSRDALQGSGRTYEFYEVKGRLIFADRVDRQIDADLLIFLSRHSSINPIPVLTVHVTGNTGKAELGGASQSLSPTNPVMMQAVLRQLFKHCPSGYRVSYEVTHHGPTELSIPSFFVEIGSTEKEWVDQRAGEAVAKSVLEAAPIDAIPLIGFGGNHYAARQTEIAINSRGAFGHIVHSREVGLLDEALIHQMQEKTGAVAAYIDKKALQKEVLKKLTNQLHALQINRLSESEIVGIGSLSWKMYCEIRDLTTSISKEARCHIHAIDTNGQLEKVSVNPVLLSEVQKVDEQAFLQGLDELPVIHLSGRENRLLPVFFTYAKYTTRIINDLNTLCVKIIRIKEIIAQDGDHLIIKKVRFDPDKARNLGVPQGPLYKALAAGQSVEVSGRVVTPAMVSSSNEIRIHIPGLENIS